MDSRSVVARSAWRHASPAGISSAGGWRALPLNEPVTIEFTPEEAGEVAFACGMNMLKGVVVVQSAP
jgi:plastocyanin domain-containing protein